MYVTANNATHDLLVSCGFDHLPIMPLALIIFHSTLQGLCHLFQFLVKFGGNYR